MDQLVKGLESGSGNLEGVLFKGMENLKRGGKPVLPGTHPVSVPDLRRIRDGLKFVKERLTGQTVWTCCLVAFWGTFRLGELLGKAERAFDRFSDLLWGDLELNTDRVIIKIKAPKTRGPPGNRAILFKIPDPTLCPVTALNRLHASQQNLGLLDDRLPVFRKTGGKILTKREFLGVVNKANGDGPGWLTGKSFRAGLPSALENFPPAFQESHVKALGRWRGRSYQLYMRNDSAEFQWVFNLVARTILKNPSMQESWKDGPTISTESWNRPMASGPLTLKTNLTRKGRGRPKKTTGKIGKN